MTTTPRPTYIYGGSVRHIARPDHPHGVEVTDVAFCGAHGEDRDQPANLRICRRCSEGWFGWLERLRDRELREAAEEEAVS